MYLRCCQKQRRSFYNRENGPNYGVHRTLERFLRYSFEAEYPICEKGMGDIEWQCGECGTIIDGPETRKCPNCGGINFYPLASEVPGDEQGSMTVHIDLDRALERISSDDAEQEE